MFILLINSQVPISLNEAIIANKFGLSYFWLKIIGLPVAIICTYLFYSYTKDVISAIIFGFSPLFVKTSFLSPVSILSLIFILIFFKFKSNKIIVAISVVLFALTVIGNKTIFPDLLPKSYTYIIDRRLSFDFIYGSPLIKGEINYNRIVHNKIFYGFNELTKKIIEPFNFEKLVSPWQSQTILEKDGGITRSLNALYFWEIPVIFAGIVTLLSAKQKFKNKWLLITGIFLTIIFKDSIIFLLPSLIIFETYFIKKFIKPAILIYFISFVLFINFFINHQNYWVNENDYAQKRIWNSISIDDLKTNKITMTDRFGDPKYYFEFYKKANASNFNIEFRSFDYVMEDKKSGQIWIGKGADFREKTNDYKIIRI